MQTLLLRRSDQPESCWSFTSGLRCSIPPRNATSLQPNLPLVVRWVCCQWRISNWYQDMSHWQSLPFFWLLDMVCALTPHQGCHDGFVWSLATNRYPSPLKNNLYNYPYVVLFIPRVIWKILLGSINICVCQCQSRILPQNCATTKTPPLNVANLDCFRMTFPAG